MEKPWMTHEMIQFSNLVNESRKKKGCEIQILTFRLDAFDLGYQWRLEWYV